MPLKITVVAAAALSLLLVPAAAETGKPAPTTYASAHHKHFTHKKRHVRRHYHWRGYGFLPGYEPPEVAARRREQKYRESHPFYGPAWPRFYHGRWNGGGFGPCYVSTPIGYMWTCGD